MNKPRDFGFYFVSESHPMGLTFSWGSQIFLNHALIDLGTDVVGEDVFHNFILEKN